MAQILSIDIIRWIVAGVALTCTFLIAYMVSRFLKMVFKKGSLPVETGRATIRLIQYLIYAIGGCVVLAVLQFDITEAIIGLGAFGIAISLALGNLIQSYVAGIMVPLDKAFKVGDEIRVGVFEGTVVKISMRKTVLKTKDGDTVLVPNSFLIASPVAIKERETIKPDAT